MKDTFRRLEKINEVDRKSLKDEYKEWLEIQKYDNNQPHVFYI